MIRTADPRTPAQVQRNPLKDKNKPVNASDGIYSSKSYDHDDVIIKEKKDERRRKNRKEMTFSRNERIEGEDDEDS